MTIPALIRSPLVLWANSTSNQLQEAWQSNGALDSIRLTQGDTIAVELHWLKDVATVGLIHDEVAWPANANITLALGLIDAPAEAGVFKLSYGGQATADIPFDATGIELAAKLNALSSVSLAGGVTAVKTATSYKIVWNTEGVLASTIAVAGNDLLPNCSIGVGIARAGAVGVTAINSIHIKQSPVAACTTWETADATAISIDILSSTGTGFVKTRTWALDFSILPRGGSFTITWVRGFPSNFGKLTNTSLPIDIEAMTSEGILYALQRGGGWAVEWVTSVTKISPLSYTISVGGPEVAAVPPYTPLGVFPIVSMTITNSNVNEFSTKSGLLSLNTVEVEALLAGASSRDVVLEVEVEIGGSRQTIVQAQAYIVNDLIDTDVYDLVEWGDVIPADSVVRFDTSQSLTAGQKTQARTNIGALGSTSLDSLIAKDAELELLLSAQSMSVDVIAALNGALAPTATNLFITASAGSAAYAAISHSHAISQVTGLQTSLDALANDLLGFLADVTGLQTSKADVYHTQAKSTITGLETQLSTIELSIAGLAPLVHIHDTSAVTGLETRLANLELKTAYPLSQSDFNAIDLAESPSALNVFVTQSRANTLIDSALAALQYLDATEVGALITTITNPIITNVTTLSNSFDNTGLKYGSEGNIPYTGNLTSTNYPYELTIYIGSGVYKVPMRRTY